MGHCHLKSLEGGHPPILSIDKLWLMLSRAITPIWRIITVFALVGADHIPVRESIAMLYKGLKDWLMKPRYWLLLALQQDKKSGKKVMVVFIVDKRNRERLY